MIPLLQTKTADTAHREYLQVTPGHFPDFWVGPGDEARVKVVSCPARARLPARNGLVNEVEFLGLITQNDCEIGNYHVARSF